MPRPPPDDLIVLVVPNIPKRLPDLHLLPFMDGKLECLRRFKDEHDRAP